MLQPISPEQGPLIMPAQADRDAPDVVPEPTLIDETVISDEAAPILIALGVIAPYAPDAPDDAPRERAKRASSTT